MLLPISFESQNKVTDLRPGFYACTCSTYRSNKDALQAFVFNYALAGSDAVLVCDLLIVDAVDNFYFRDFMLMPDRTWRDSYGARAESLNALLPPEIFDYRLIEQFSLETQNIGERNV